MNKKVKNNSIIIIFALFICGFSAENVWADAWWGEGYRPPAWVLQHGGTIISYAITGTDNPKKYKAMMFRDGKYVEVEFGNNATFDDAKTGLYTINFYKCSNSCMKHKYNKKTKLRSKDKLTASINVVARPGQKNNIIFDAHAKRAFLAGRSGGARKIDVFARQRKAAKEQEGNVYAYVDIHKKRYRFDQLMYLSPRTDFVKFEQKNIATGIVPHYKKSQEI